MSFGTLFFIVLAAVVLFQLWSVLGRRTGNERPPFDPYSRRERHEEPGHNDNVVTLPHRRVESGGEDEAAERKRPYEDIDDVARPDTALNRSLRAVRDADESFEPREFIDGAKMAYEMIFTAFADGDRPLLQNLLAEDVYRDFAAAIDERESRGERMHFSFVGFDEDKIIAAEMRGSDALVTVRFVSQQISAIRDSSGEVVDGDPDSVVEVRDVWTFARDTQSRDPNWKLAGTESDEE